MQIDKLAAPGVRDLVPYKPGKPTSELERELGITDITKLASNENPLGPGQRAKRAIAANLEQLGFYPDGGSYELTQALARKHAVEANWITCGNGSNDVLVMLAESFLTPNDSVVMSQFSFAVYYLATQAVGARAIVVPANSPEHDMPYGHDLDGLRTAIQENTKIVFIANPNNPTGTWVSGQALREFLEGVPGDVLVVIDQAYVEYATAPDYVDVATWVKEFPNLVVTHTFSKIHGLAALRSGYSISRPDVADYLNRVRQPFNVNTLAQAASLAALDDEEHVERSRAVNAEGIAMLSELCDEMGLSYAPSMCNFLLVDFGKPAQPVFDELLKLGVIVRPVDNYGLPNHLRISTGTLKQNQVLIEALRRILS
ncbi:MAG: histidinol-phosphate transaminase [Pseudomonadota bacterium]